MEFEKDQLVTINTDIEKTISLYSANSTMKSMIGKTFKIDEVITANKIRVNSFVWHPNDLITYTSKRDIPKPASQSILFDINKLDM